MSSHNNQSRRDFLQSSCTRRLCLLARQRKYERRPCCLSTGRMVRSAHALGAADPGGRRSRQVRPQLLAGLFQAHPLGRGVPERRRLRGVSIRPRFRCTTAASGSAIGDAFGDLVAGCRKLGMVVIARTDPHAAHQDVYDAHPDWIAVDAEGKKRRHWAMPDCGSPARSGPTTSTS